jgi:hypothetical protein
MLDPTSYSHTPLASTRHERQISHTGRYKKIRAPFRSSKLQFSTLCAQFYTYTRSRAPSCSTHVHFHTHAHSQGNVQMVFIDVPALETVGGFFKLANNEKLERVEAPMLRNSGLYLQVCVVHDSVDVIVVYNTGWCGSVECSLELNSIQCGTRRCYSLVIACAVAYQFRDMCTACTLSLPLHSLQGNAILASVRFPVLTTVSTFHIAVCSVFLSSPLQPDYN